MSEDAMCSLCEKCESLPPVQQCCGIGMCHLCIKKHKCPAIPCLPIVGQSNNSKHMDDLIEQYKRRNESLSALVTMYMNDLERQKEENKKLYEENQELIMQVDDLRQQLVLGYVNSDNVQQLPPVMPSSPVVSPRLSRADNVQQQPAEEPVKAQVVVSKTVNKSSKNSMQQSCDIKNTEDLASSSVKKKVQPQITKTGAMSIRDQRSRAGTRTGPKQM